MKSAANLLADFVAVMLVAVAFVYSFFGMILLIIILKIEVSQIILVAGGFAYVIWRVARRHYGKSLFNTKQGNRNFTATVVKPCEDVDAATQLQRDQAEWNRILSQ